MVSSDSIISPSQLVNPDDYQIDDTSELLSPSPVVFKELLEFNLAEMVRIAGSAERLRPHCKTHKMPHIINMKKKLGITKFKCATIAEAEILAAAGAEDVLIAYQLVGPNIKRLVELIDKFPSTRFATIVDDLGILEQLSEMLAHQEQNLVGIFVDLDSGMGRTGIAPDDQAIQLYESIASAPGVEVAGIHWYDGHIRHTDLNERRIVVESEWQQLSQFRNQLMLTGLPIDEVVVSGTGAFPIWAEIDEPGLTLSPGTTVLYDIGYRECFPDLRFKPALGVLTRVISSHRAGQLTLDLGHKSIAADQPAGKRAYLPELPDAVELSHTEEHLVIETSCANEYSVGDSLIALPRHVCPTSALHQFATVVENKKIIDQWPIVARDRLISV